MDAADFGGFQPSVMTLCLPSQYHHHNHHHHLSTSHGGSSSAADSFRPYGSGGNGNPSSSSSSVAAAAAAAAVAAAADLSLFSPMSDSLKGPGQQQHGNHYGGGPLSAGGSQPSHKLMSIIKSQAGLNSEVERIQSSTSSASLGSNKLRQSTAVAPSSSSATASSSPTSRTVCSTPSAAAAAASISHHFNLGGKEVSPGGGGMHPSLSPWFIQQQQQQQQKPIGSNKKRRQLSESASGRHCIQLATSFIHTDPPPILSRLIYKKLTASLSSLSSLSKSLFWCFVWLTLLCVSGKAKSKIK